MSSPIPLPADWCDAVIRILKRASSAEVRWSHRARQDWQQFGMSHQAYELLIRTLQGRGLWGERIDGMNPLPNPPKGEQQTVYAFLCPHPFNPNVHLYAKIGLFDGLVTLDLFSLHIDLSSTLEKRIATAKKKAAAKNKKANK